MRVVAVVLAAGKGERFGQDKVSLNLGGKPVWRWSFDTLVNHPEIESVGLVVSPGKVLAIKSEAQDAAFVLSGGANRQESSLIAVEASDGDIVLLQDAARPFVSVAVISRVIAGVMRSGAAAPAIPINDTLRAKRNESYALVDRTTTVAMQTPQGALRRLLLDAHRAANEILTDEMALIDQAGGRFEIVEGEARNFKITMAGDYERARAMVETLETRTGIGYDIHPFSTDLSRPLMLGGIRFDGAPALDGHSDADVVIHAAVDAILGAAGLGDIGQHFPNSDPRWKGEASITFLKHAAALLAANGWILVNLDISVIAEKPKVMGRSPEVRNCLAGALGIEPGRISFKATTNEGLGSLGRAEGIAAFAVATIRGG